MRRRGIVISKSLSGAQSQFTEAHDDDNLMIRDTARSRWRQLPLRWHRSQRHTTTTIWWSETQQEVDDDSFPADDRSQRHATTTVWWSKTQQEGADDSFPWDDTGHRGMRRRQLKSKSYLKLRASNRDLPSSICVRKKAPQKSLRYIISSNLRDILQ